MGFYQRRDDIGIADGGQFWEPNKHHTIGHTALAEHPTRRSLCPL
jgi:hypothetical protein